MGTPRLPPTCRLRTDRIYQYNGGAFFPGGGTWNNLSTSFPRAPGNTNPQGIADPPVTGDALPVFSDEAASGLSSSPGRAGENEWQTGVDALMADDEGLALDRPGSRGRG